MNSILWILQGMLATAFLGVGSMKLIRPKQKLESRMGWVSDFGSGSVKTIGLLEVLAGIGLIVPAVLDVAPIMAAWAASGLVALMIGATATHARRKEYQLIIPALFLAVLAMVAAWGRFGPYSL